MRVTIETDNSPYMMIVRVNGKKIGYWSTIEGAIRAAERELQMRHPQYKDNPYREEKKDG